VRVSQYLAENKIYGAAIVGRGRKASIRIAGALEQLRRNLMYTSAPAARQDRFYGPRGT
jgi:hypothetical protein